jgi:hypothetical protein
VWDTKAKVRAFAQQLQRRTGKPAWEVVGVNGPPREGPLGPVLIQLARRGDELIFALEFLSRVMIQSALPQVFRGDTVSIETQAWYDYRTT